MKMQAWRARNCNYKYCLEVCFIGSQYPVCCSGMKVVQQYC